LARNLLDDEAMKNLATYISNIPNLEEFDISFNIITEKKGEKALGLKYIFAGILAKKHSLRKLMISGNRGIGNDGTIDLLQQLIEESSTLTQLEMSAMGMDAKICKSFTEYLIGQFGKKWNL
jgi:Ran GTPase-activating protein (RanGAP) involved in mRNA processing and transport